MIKSKQFKEDFTFWRKEDWDQTFVSIVMRNSTWVLRKIERRKKFIEITILLSVMCVN
jgi:hypothetical protein